MCRIEILEQAPMSAVIGTKFAISDAGQESEVWKPVPCQSLPEVLRYIQKYFMLDRIMARPKPI
jgi:hypothetical protein